MPPDGASCLLVQGDNTAEASCLLFHLLVSRAPPYDRVLDWLQFAYTGDGFGAYVAPDYTYFDFHTLAEGEPLFSPAL